MGCYCRLLFTVQRYTRINQFDAQLLHDWSEYFSWWKWARLQRKEETSITFSSFLIALSSYKILFLIKIICFLQRNNNGCRVTSNCMDAIEKRFKRMPGRSTALTLVGFMWHNEQYCTLFNLYLVWFRELWESVVLRCRPERLGATGSLGKHCGTVCS
jgi:hypothetical protein